MNAFWFTFLSWYKQLIISRGVERGFYECFCVSERGGGRVGPPLTRPSPSVFWFSFRVLRRCSNFFSRVCVARATAFFVFRNIFIFSWTRRGFPRGKNFFLTPNYFCRSTVNTSLVQKTIFRVFKLCCLFVLSDLDLWWKTQVTLWVTAVYLTEFSFKFGCLE